MIGLGALPARARLKTWLMRGGGASRSEAADANVEVVSALVGEGI